MQAPLPLASYAFILRKHLWLVLGTVAVVLAGGWLYAKNQDPVFQATALVQLQGKPQVQAATPGAIILGDDQRFVNDQSYRLRQDEALAGRVLAHLRDPAGRDAAGGPAPASDGTVEPLPSKLDLVLRPGERLETWTTGGGGFGDPLERDPALVFADVLDGKLGAKAAAEHHGVAIRDGALDEEETAALRALLREERGPIRWWLDRGPLGREPW